MKLYYEDALAAAYMAREFHVLYGDDQCAYTVNFVDTRLRLVARGGFEKYGVGDAFRRCPTDAKDYIHPDSYSIFEPMEGDMVIYEGYCSANLYHPTRRTKGCEIIQRNNKPFFMPEREE